MAWDSKLATEHIGTLAERHDVQITWTERPAYSYTTHRSVHVPPPTTADRYLAGLHEMGHCVSQQALRFDRRWRKGTQFDDEVLMEAAAWAWAARNALDALEVPKRAWSVAGRCFGTYLAHIDSR